MSKTVDGGIVTAYGAAKRGGYAGSYDDFCADLAQLAEVLQEFQNFSAEASTLPPGSAATASYESGVLSLGIPQGVKGDTGNGIQSIALLSTSGLVKTYRVTYTSGDTFDFPVQDGNGITETVLNQDYTMTITYANGTTWTSGSIRGATGATPDISIGTVTTLPAGYSATAEMTGTAEAPVLNLGLPKGADGEVTAASMAPVFDATAAYSEGDYVWYAGQLYKFTADHAAGAWTGSDAQAAKVADDVADLTRQLNDETTGLNSKAPVILETASGAIASFSDGADSMPIKKLVAQIEPVQDLHGYDYPWPGGGGVNIFNKDGTDTSNGYIAGKYLLFGGGEQVPGSGIAWNISEYIPITPSTSYTLSGLPTTSSSSTSICQYNANKEYITGVNYANSAQVTITTDSSAAFVRLSIPEAVVNTLQLEKGSTASAWTPYSNICPISGWTGAEIEQTGVNVWDEETESGSLYTITGAETPSSTQIRAKYFCNVKAGEEYCVCTKTGIGNGVWMLFYDRDKKIISDGLPFGDGSANNSRRIDNGSKFTAPANCCYIRFYFQAGYGTTYLHDTSINYPATDTEYHPHTGNQISVTFPSEAGTVYGGTLTLNPDRTGTLVVDRAMADMGALNWAAYSAGINTYRTQIALKAFGDLNLICSAYKTEISAFANMTNGTIRGATGNAYVYVRDNNYTDVTSFKSAVTGQTIVYELANPQTYTLTAAEVSSILTTLYGTNNIWSSTGDTEVTYPADTKLYIDNKITQAIANAFNS